MIIVHDIFICKPGNASKLAKLFKEVMAGNDKKLVNIMTDHDRPVQQSRNRSASMKT